ncbi:MAG TPA: MBL fold metallo-hydrolase [Aggregatilineales bacterium]|nr:MBL fold metallo-hydrolase [Aggregatilineales bacterium]
MEIAPGIHRIKCHFGSNRMVFVHLLIGEEASMLVDTGCAHNPAQEILPYMESIGFEPERLTYILITHSDTEHQGGSQPMKQAASRALLMGHNLDRPWIESTEALIKGRYSQFEQDHGIGYSETQKQAMRKDCLSLPVDITLEGGETFRLGARWSVETIHTPGSTWGHTAVFDPRSRTLIAADAAMSTHIPTDDWQPAAPPLYCYIDTYIATQERLMAMDIYQFASAHWPLQQDRDVVEFLCESKNYCLLVERRLLDLAQIQPFTLREAIDKLGPTLGSWPVNTNQDFSYAMLGNLNSLTKRGLLKATRDSHQHLIWGLP